MRRDGILNRIHRTFAFKLPPTTDNTKLSVDLHDTVPHFVILTTGIAISLCVFVACECALGCAHAKSNFLVPHKSSVDKQGCKITRLHFCKRNYPE